MEVFCSTSTERSRKSSSLLLTWSIREQDYPSYNINVLILICTSVVLLLQLDFQHTHRFHISTWMCKTAYFKISQLVACLNDQSVVEVLDNQTDVFLRGLYIIDLVLKYSQALSQMPPQVLLVSLCVILHRVDTL